MKLTKEDAIKTVVKCAKIYNEQVLNKNFIFLYLNENSKVEFLEVVFEKHHYLHLTGLTVNKQKLSSNLFFDKCLNSKLSPKDFGFKEDGTTKLKLDILPQIIKFGEMCKMIGDYNGSNPKLCTEKITGSIYACIGFTKEQDFYVPNTALKEDTRNLIAKTHRIIAIFSKTKKQEKYSIITYMAKNVDILKMKMSEDLAFKINTILLSTKKIKWG